ncbi:MAG TPA: nucleoside triphosphate pyrophosphatase [Thermotogota bacterium]|nr:septum formation protein Maf [Thermotogota bacterium]NLZ13670.1 septum formation protein Maf [Thermotogaceae bacterium]MDD8041094.1 Maf family protein [Thermotogota bacterium]MDD8052869.1 Maf family protein [Thermotogota bacterium]HNR63930.1 nucleoside triphosphate pyrophosphatase [Thermotogota bacterium]
MVPNLSTDVNHPENFIIVLGSSSPRRKELCARFGLPIVTVDPDVVEEALTQRFRIPQEITTEIALAKLRATERAMAEELAEKIRGKNRVLIAADTMVFLGEERMGKPQHPEQAEEMLHKLSGKWHDVYTGVGMKLVWNGSREQQMYFCERTRVLFRKLPDEAIQKYVRSGVPLDKAGAYGIQDEGGFFVDQIRGDFYNVMGFPLGRIWELLYNNGAIR